MKKQEQGHTKERAGRNRTLVVLPEERDTLKGLVKEMHTFDATRWENTIVNADLLEIIDLIPDGIADLIIIDPPYNLSKDFNGWSFSAISSEKYAEYLRTWFHKVCDKLKPGGSLYMCGDWKCTSALQTVVEERLTVLNRITWQREKGRGARNNWKNWRTDFFAKLPLGYRGGEFIFAASTVETYLQTMSDDNNNPVFYQATGLEVNDGDAQNPNGRFFGRNISLVEPDILPDFDTASANDIVGIYWQPEEYMVNENFGFTMLRYFDQETNEWVDKALTVVDGKVLNPAGIYLIAKGT